MDIETVLSRWGRSALLGDARSLDYPSMTTFARLARSTGAWAVGAAPLQEEHHALVDAAVSALRVRSPDRWVALVGHYVYGWSDKRLGVKLRCSTTAARSVRVAATAWVEALVDPVLED